LKESIEGYEKEKEALGADPYRRGAGREKKSQFFS